MSYSYRPDIDGLRAIAVIPVILFHADIPIFSGGYVGVDIFFVISGYLITSILLKDIKQGEFSIFTFYERRIRRILPALFTVLMVSSCVALWIMLPAELESFGKSLLAATLFYSNYHFMFSAGYFTSPAETKPLLHMWSLAVEEQFYIIFPVYLYIISHYFKNKLGAVTVMILVLSLLYSIIIVYMSPSDAFYSTPARVWELMAGAVLAIYPRKQSTLMDSRIANILTVTGIGAIIYSIFFYTKETVFPGMAALLPVIGTALIIYAGASDKNIVGSLLATKIFRFPGLLSYSLYLWHWPVLVFYKMYAIGPVSIIEIAMIIGVTTILSYLSWKFVETPFRKRQFLSNQKSIILTGASVMIVSATVGIALIIGNGFPARYSSEINKLQAVSTDSPKIIECQLVGANTDSSLKVCEIGSAKKGVPTFAVWGDSHGEAIYPGIDMAAKYSNMKGVYIGQGGCLPLLGAYQIRQGYKGCVDIANAFILYLSDHPEINKIILVSRWSIYAMGIRFRNEKGHTVYIKDSYTDLVSLEENRRVFARSMERTLDRLSMLGRQIVLVTQVPETEWNIPLDAARAKLLNRDIDLRPKVSDYLDRQAFVTETIEKYKEKYAVKLVRPHEEMCAGDYCMVSKNGIPIYRDSNHLTSNYAEKLSKLFNGIFSAAKVPESTR